MPHVGWNALDFEKPARILAGLTSGAQVYFTHSFAAPVTPDCAAATTHANTFASVVERELHLLRAKLRRAGHGADEDVKCDRQGKRGAKRRRALYDIRRYHDASGLSNARFRGALAR